MYLGLFVTIHQDTSGSKITIHVSWMRHDDTSGYIPQIHHDTCILDASSEPRWIHTRYVRDAIQIRSRYVSRYPLGSFYLPCCPRSSEGDPPLRHSIPNESKIHFGIHMRYIKIHVSCSLPMCHTGYITGYIRIHVSWTLRHNTSRYIRIQNHDTCILDAS